VQVAGIEPEYHRAVLMPIEERSFHADRLDSFSIAAVRTCASLIRLSSTFGDLSK